MGRDRARPKRAAWTMVAVALAAFGIGEGGRLLVTSLDTTLVQWHRTFAVSSELLVPVWLATLVVTFVGLRLEDKGLAIGAGLYIGGGLCNLSELAWLGGVADYIPVFGYVCSLGDVSAFVGCLFAIPPLLEYGRAASGRMATRIVAVWGLLAPGRYVKDTD